MESKKISCILIEDEPIARDILHGYINQIPGLNLEHAFNDARDALVYLRNHTVDLLLLDINLPGMSGIEFYKSLNSPPNVIFTTAYNEFAVDGFNLDAVDYLLKPFSFDRFLKAINKLFKQTIIFDRQEGDGMIMLKSEKRIYPVDFSDIFYIEGMGDYVSVYTKDSRLIVRETMKEIGIRLEANSFVRIHKSYIINILKVDYIEGNQVKISDRLLPVGGSYKEQFLLAFESKRIK